MSAPTKGWAYFKYSLRRNWSLYLLVLPVLIYFLIFLYWPMYGVIIAFKDFSPGKGIWGSPWATLNGEVNIFKHFINFFSSVHFTRTLRNTLGISFYSLAVGFPIPLILAILMNELRSAKFKSFVQTVTYLPHFISTVVMCGMLWIFLRSDTGMVNLIIKALGGAGFNFMNENKYFKSVYVWSGVWQNAGWGTIIYMATLSGLDTQMYEAANIDGANKWQQIWYITLPCLMPTAVMLLILDSGSIMSVGFEKVFLLQTDLTFEASDVISTLVYRKGITEANYSFSSAVGLFNSGINCIILLTVNWISKKLGDVSLF
ncbi:MAG: ABC transporter permease subunit [Oscillospiraceae bacterium]|nr:ABC transporter permease subunit [Oscillospiraceae bacterium]